MSRLVDAHIETLKVLLWIVASAAVNALWNALQTGEWKVDPQWVPVINLLFYYAKELLKARTPANASTGG